MKIMRLDGTVALENDRANLRGADLQRANLRGADLQRANLRGADLQGVVGMFSLGNPDGWPAWAWLRDDILSIRVGCREFRLAGAVEHWRDKPDRREVLAAVGYAAQVAQIRGWRLS